MHSPTRAWLALFLLLLTLLIPAACSSSAQKLEGEGWVIFPAERAEELGIGGWLLPGGQTPEYWTPTEEQVLALESGLIPFLQKNSGSFRSQNPPVWERLEEYKRQYAGIMLDGKQVMYANYFCSSLDMDWKQDFVFVLDGGECFFQFKYEAGSGEFFDLQVNGDA